VRARALQSACYVARPSTISLSPPLFFLLSRPCLSVLVPRSARRRRFLSFFAVLWGCPLLCRATEPCVEKIHAVLCMMQFLRIGRHGAPPPLSSLSLFGWLVGSAMVVEIILVDEGGSRIIGGAFRLHRLPAGLRPPSHRNCRWHCHVPFDCLLVLRRSSFLVSCFVLRRVPASCVNY